MRRIFLIFYAGLCLPVRALGDSSSVQLSVAVQVETEINASATPVDFGSISHFALNKMYTAEAVLTVNSEPGLTYFVAMDAGRNPGFGKRAMKSDGNVVPYELYKDSGYTVIWGDAGYGNTYALGNAMGPMTSNGATQQIKVYAKIEPLPQAPPPGFYQDIITWSIHY